MSRRELQVLKLLAEGHKSREISEILNRSLRTIENQRYSLLKKLDRPSPMELVSTARELGLLVQGPFNRPSILRWFSLILPDLFTPHVNIERLNNCHTALNGALLEHVAEQAGGHVFIARPVQ